MFLVAAELAYRQLRHRGAKLIGALLGVCMAIVLMFTQIGFRDALYDSAAAIPQALDADILIAGPTYHSVADSPPWMPRSLLYEAAGVPGVKLAIPFYANVIQLSSPVDGRALSALLLAYPPHSSVFTSAAINSHLSDIALSDQAMLDISSRSDFSLVRDTVEASGHMDMTFLNPGDYLQKVMRVSGLFEIGSSFTIDGTLVTSDINYYRFTSYPLDRVSIGIIRVLPGYNPGKVEDALKLKFGERAKIYSKKEFVENEISYFSTEKPIGFIFQMGLFVGVVVGIVFISQALHGIVNDNIREYATLKAMGYKQSFFIILVGTISVALSMIAYIPSSLVAWGVYSLASAATQLPLQMKLSNMTLIFWIVLLMGIAATLLAIRKLKNADPVDLFS